MPKRTKQTPNESFGRSNMRAHQSTVANRVARPSGTTATTARRTSKGTTTSPTR